MNVILCGRNKGWGSKSLEKYLGKGDIMNIMGTHRIPIMGTEDVVLLKLEGVDNKTFKTFNQMYNWVNIREKGYWRQEM